MKKNHQLQKRQEIKHCQYSVHYAPSLQHFSTLFWVLDLIQTVVLFWFIVGRLITVVRVKLISIKAIIIITGIIPLHNVWIPNIAEEQVRITQYIFIEELFTKDRSLCVSNNCNCFHLLLLLLLASTLDAIEDKDWLRDPSCDSVEVGADHRAEVDFQRPKKYKNYSLWWTKRLSYMKPSDMNDQSFKIYPHLCYDTLTMNCWLFWKENKMTDKLSLVN